MSTADPTHRSHAAADRWREEIGRWGIPQEILDRAPESPWTFPLALFGSRADAALQDEPSASALRALEALPGGGSVLDIGSGAGAASLPLAKRAGRITALDTSQEMLAAFAERARRAGVAFDVIEGQWPDVEAQAPVADVVVCNHVVYNVSDLDRFVGALTRHARRRVVVELTPEHPTANMNPLWERFHGLRRPHAPTVDDAVAVIREALGVEPRRDDWGAEPAGTLTREEMVAWIRRRLCLSPGRDADVAAALQPMLMDHGDDRVSFGARPIVTLSWPGFASPDG